MGKYTDRIAKIKTAPVRTRQECINQIKSVYETWGIRLPKGFEDFPDAVLLKEVLRLDREGAKLGGG